MKIKDLNVNARPFALCLALMATGATISAQQPQPASPPTQPAPSAGQTPAQTAPVTAAPVAAPAQTPAAQPAIVDWGDEFDGERLDATKWEMYSMAGGGGKIEVKDNQLRMRGVVDSRYGVRSKQTFRGERFYVEAGVAKVEPQFPKPGEDGHPLGFATLTVLFAGNAANRVEWTFRSDGLFEVWSVVDGRGERLDNRKLGTKEKNPRLGIGRRGDQFFFMLNGQIGLEQTLRGFPADFKVMLYGFGSSENDWDTLKVQTVKQ